MDNRNYIIAFTERFAYPEAACGAFLAAYDAMCAEPAGKAEFEALLAIYAENRDCDYQALLARIHALSEASGLHHYIGTTVLYICMAQNFIRTYLAAVR